MSQKPVLDKIEFSKYAEALLKNYNVVLRYGEIDRVAFPEKSPSELVAHSVFSTENSLFIICRGTSPLGGIKWRTKRCPIKDCKVVELIVSTKHIEELTPNHLDY